MALPYKKSMIRTALSTFKTLAMFSTKPHTTTSLSHASLHGTLLGAQYERDGVAVTQYRGVKYATVARRFAKPVRADGLVGKVVDCQEFG